MGVWQSLWPTLWIRLETSSRCAWKCSNRFPCLLLGWGSHSPGSATQVWMRHRSATVTAAPQQPVLGCRFQGSGYNTKPAAGKHLLCSLMCPTSQPKHTCCILPAWSGFPRSCLNLVMTPVMSGPILLKPSKESCPFPTYENLTRFPL